MATRRPRRTGRQQTLLPLRAGQVSNSISCWYCDWKVRALNSILFSIGHRYARHGVSLYKTKCKQIVEGVIERSDPEEVLLLFDSSHSHAKFLHVWFTIGAASTVVVLVGVAALLIWEFAGPFHLHNGTFALNNLSLSWLFGTFPPTSGLSTWIMNVGIMFFSTSLSVAVHEFGHAIAAASEGIQIEYIAIFLAIIFPGALVALNYDLLQSLQRLAALRIYCAGIWHNLMFLFWLLLCSFIVGKWVQVLAVPHTSPLTGYLSRGDVIAAVDGSKISYPNEWTDKMIQINFQMHQKAFSGRKGYCVPNTWLDGTNNTHIIDDNFSCPDELATFVTVSCPNSSLSAGISSEDSNVNRRETNQCLTAKDVVKLNKCGDGWEMIGTDRSNCTCLEDESCMAPVQIPGMSWVEISYSTPYSSECSQLRKNTSINSEISDDRSTACGGTFVFVGDVLTLANSIWLSSYQPRSAFLSANIPTLLECILSCTFHVSATLSILNSLPVFFLDGESILEMGLYYITWLNPKRRRKVLRFCLTGGSIMSMTVFARILYTLFALPLGY